MAIPEGYTRASWLRKNVADLATATEQLNAIRFSTGLWAVLTQGQKNAVVNSYLNRFDTAMAELTALRAEFDAARNES